MSTTTRSSASKARIWVPVGFALLLVILVGLWILARLMGWFNFYSVASGANEPTLKHKEYFFTTNLRQPERGDFICYLTTSPLTEGREETFVFRLCGLPGDTVSFREGVLFINGRMADSRYRIKHAYTIPSEALSRATSNYDVNENEVAELSDSLMLVQLEDKHAHDPQLRAKRFLMPEGMGDEMIQAHWGKAWNADYFGPVVVPEGHWFVAGDNRNNALDSRYTGFVPVADYVATVLKDR
jgi:signal peptidase I